MIPPVKLNWLDRAIEVRNFHIQQCKSESHWTLKKTATALNRSLSSVADDVLVASWVKTHEKQLKRFDSMREALRFVRAREREMRLGD